MNLASSKRQWPLGRGFERYYGFLGGETNQWYPDLVYDNHPVAAADARRRRATTSRSTSPTRRSSSSRTPRRSRPTSRSSSTTAPAPRTPRTTRRRSGPTSTRGRFDMGYEAYRELVFERQKQMGIVPDGAELSPINPYADTTSHDGKPWSELDRVRPWDSLSDDEKRLFARMAEVYAGFLSHADHELGRLLDYLEETGELDNTIIVLVSDNGASGEGGPNGSVNENKFFNGVPDTIEENLAHARRARRPADLQPLPDRLGVGVQHAVQDVEALLELRGRHRRPADRLLAARASQRTGEIRRQYCHAVDIVPDAATSASASSCPTSSTATRRSRSRASASSTRFADADAPTRQADAVLLDARHAGDLARGLEGGDRGPGGAGLVGRLPPAALGAVRHRRPTRASATTSPSSTR